MKIAFNIAAAVTGIFLLFLTVGVFISGWERPPMESHQVGYRGTGMEQIINPRLQDSALAENVLPTASDPAPPGGRPAREAYQNVQILGDLTEDQFNRVMASITEWVSPEQGCNYCHNPENLAEDVPNKIVARRMFQMTRHINQNWTQHVAQTGVTCYTCHRGRPVPADVWFRQSTEQPSRGGLLGYDAGQNHPAKSVNMTSLPLDPFSEQLDSPEEVRVIGRTPLPASGGQSIKKAEHTYALMIHMSESLGVNCVFCHNSRSFFDWDQSVPARQPAWHAIRMVRELNQSFISPLKPVFRQERLGPLGDVPKLNCATCHRGQPKPLGGAQLLKDNPELNLTALEPIAGPAPETVPAEREAQPPTATPPGQPQRGQPAPAQ
jgi:photosynthetic reaction center cytochrome c subunit